MSIIQGTSKAAGGGYEIDQSCRFNDGDTPELSRTYTLSAPWTFSAWVKRGELTSENLILGATAGEIHFNADDTLEAETTSSTALFRDPSAWYHIHVSDGGMYVNGVSHGAVTTTALTNTKLFDDFDGYAAEVHLQTGTSAYTNFGESNTDGVWIPKSATAGDTYLKFANSADFGTNSGTGGAWTATNLATTDQMLDTPTLNWCTWNNIDTSFNNNVTSDGNLVITTASPGYTRFQLGTIGVSSGKWEWKWTPTASLSDGGIGVDDGTSQAATGASSGALTSQSANGFIYRSNGTKLVGGTASSYGATFVANDVIRCQIDLDAGTPTIEFFKNDVSQGSINMNAGVTYFPCQFSADAGLVTVADFGQSGFTAAAGFNLLNTSNLPSPSITDGSAHFQPTLYTGTGSSLAVTQAGNSTFQPDWVWIKGRSGATEHVLTDAVRGVTKELSSNDAGAEETVAQGLTTFGSAGFTVGTDGSYNTSSATYVGWQWAANGAGSSNTDGTITSTASANTTAGFSVVKYAGNLSATGSATIGHGLGIAPSVVISKSMDSTAGDSGTWAVQHTSLAASNILRLNTTAATSSKSGNGTLSSPTSTVFYTNYTEGLNVTGNDYIAYCFAEVPGYSSFGSYTGNSLADGPFVYCGFKPAFIMTKRTDSTSDWTIEDTTRSTFNLVENALFPNLTSAEDTIGDRMDILSNGFKLRTTAQPNIGTLIYMAFAENPFGGDGAAPATAR